MDKALFTEKIIAWYNDNKRLLPWRNTNSPYHIWLSEIILQQTRVAQGLPYYNLFIEAYPTVSHLAAADEKEVLRLWQGLGYYSRARNLHTCAKAIASELDGKFPTTMAELLRLKGIGKYTAAAISSFAFRNPDPVVDGNVYRVLSRIFGLEDDIAAPATHKVFYQLSEQLISRTSPDLYNQAVMEFGALHCTPVSPKCSQCIFKDGCVAFREGKQEKLPVKNKKLKIKSRHFHYFILMYGDKIFMKERRDKDIWKGLYDFYLFEDRGFKHLLNMDDPLIEQLKKTEIDIVEESPVYKHVLTHQHLFVKFFSLKIFDISLKTLFSNKYGLNLYSVIEIAHLPKPILVNNYLKERFF